MYDLEVMLQVTTRILLVHCLLTKDISERGRGERLYLRIFEDQEPDGRISGDGDVL